MIRKVCLALIAATSTIVSVADTETVNGITWTYTVSKGK